MKYAVNARHVPEALGSSSQGTTAGRFIFVSGQLPVEEHDNKKLVGDDVAQQVERELDITANILSTIDLTLTDVAQTTVYLTDLNDLRQWTESMRSALADPRRRARWWRCKNFL